MSNSNNEGKILKNSVGVSLATLASRFLGLLRVRLEALTLGGGTIASIWFLTLMIPNLLRRLLGEGALGTALTPIIAETERAESISQARKHLAQIFAMLGALLALIVVIVSLAAWFWGRHGILYGYGIMQSDRVIGTCQLLPLIMPYAFFICLTGVIGAVLNYSGIFVRPALTALFFNLCMILGLCAGVFFHLPPQSLLTLLALLTPAAGAIQFLLMLWLLFSCGRFPIFDRETFKNFAVTGRLIKLATPGLIGYGVLQLSFLIDRTLALYLNDQAVPALTYVDRIIDLPIGLFAVSLGSVLMAAMTHAAAEKDWDAMRRQLNFSLRHVWFVGAPMAAGVIFFHVEILRVLCLGGRYTQADLDATCLVAIFYGMGIPFFCTLKVLLPAFYSRQDMKRPFYVSLAAISLNIILNLILMFPLKQGGLALATVIASITNNTVLLFLLHRDGFPLEKSTILSCCRSGAIAFASGAAVWFIMPFIRCRFSASFGNDCLLLLICAIAFAVTFFVLAILCRTPELKEFFNILRRKKKNSD